MTKKMTGRERRMSELLETAEGLHRSGLMTSTDYDKITAKHADLTKIERLEPPSGREIVALREKANMSQAVFARILNVGTSTLSQWERKEKRPRGKAARLLAIVKAKGVRAILGSVLRPPLMPEDTPRLFQTWGTCCVVKSVRWTPGPGAVNAAPATAAAGVAATSGAKAGAAWEIRR